MQKKFKAEPVKGGAGTKESGKQFAGLQPKEITENMRALQGDLQRFNKALGRKARIVQIAVENGFNVDVNSIGSKFNWSVFNVQLEQKKPKTNF